MKRDKTVTIALIVFFVSVIAAASNIYPEIFTVLYWVAAIRLIVLWFQTFIDAVKEGEVGWAIAHVLLPGIVSVIYYYKFAGSWDYN